ncbi:MAG: metallophosphoesterase family protein [Anaerolineae bacterium]
MLTLLHCADLHLEARFGERMPRAWADRRRAGLRAALTRLLDEARTRRVDAVTIAGDLYDGQNATPEMGHWLREQFAALAPTRVYIAPGSSDAYTAGSLYAHSPWPANVHIFVPGAPAAVELAPGVYLWGAALPVGPEQRSLPYLRPESPGTHLLLAHGAPAAPAFDVGNLYSIDPSALAAAGFQAALLGCLHTAWRTDEPLLCVYPGSPEPLAPHEALGSHGALLVSVEGKDCRAEFIPIAQWRYASLTMDLGACASVADAAALISQKLKEAGLDRHSIARVTLTGTEGLNLDAAALRAHVETPAWVHYQQRRLPTSELEDVAEPGGVKGLLGRRRNGHRASEQVRREAATADLALHTLDGRRRRRLRLS